MFEIVGQANRAMMDGKMLFRRILIRRKKP